MNQERHIVLVADVELAHTGLVEDNHPADAAADSLHVADAVLYHHNPADVVADYTAPGEPRQEVHRTAAVADNHPAAEHRDHVVVVVRHRTVVVGERHNPMGRWGRSSPAAGVERHHIAAEMDTRRRRSCHSSR